MLKYRLTAIFSILFLLLICGMSPVNAAAEQHPELVIEKAVLLDRQGVEGEFKLETLNKQSVLMELGTFIMPGAYVRLRITLRNTGTFVARLKNINEWKSELDGLIIMYSFGSDAGSGSIRPNESREFETIVCWDYDSARNYIDKETAEFSLRLNYDGDAAELVPGDPPETGESDIAMSISLLLLISGTVLGCLTALRVKIGRTQ